MSSKKVFVSLENKKVKVNCSTYSSVFNETKSKLNISSDAFRLEYFNDEANDWIILCNDEDLEDVSTSTKIRVISEETKTEENDLIFLDFDVATFDAKKLSENAKKLPKQPKEGDNSKRYFIDPANKSQALVFNLLFPNCNEKLRRRGAQNDSSSLKVLLNYLGFETQIETKDQTEKEIKKTIDEFLKSEKVAAASMVLLFIGSHGVLDSGEDYFLDAKQNPVKLKSIVDMFATTENFKVLEGKPKLFLLQFCRNKAYSEKPQPDGGTKSFKSWYKSQMEQQSRSISTEPFEYGTNSPSTKQSQICRNSPGVLICRNMAKVNFRVGANFTSNYDPQMKTVGHNSSSLDTTTTDDELNDMFLGYATKPRFSAYRVGSGSWFVMSLCVAFFKNAHQDKFRTLFQKTNLEVQKKSSEESKRYESNYEQVCDVCDGLEKDLYFYSI